MLLETLIKQVTAATGILPVALYLFYKRKSRDKGLRLIFYLLTTSFLVDVFSLYLEARHRDNILIFNFFLLIETFSLYYFLSIIIATSLIKKLLAILSIIFFGWWLYLFIKFGSRGYYDACTSFENFSVLGCILYYYYEQITGQNVLNIYKHPRFWIATAYFIFIAGTFFLILYIPTINADPTLKEEKNYYTLNYVFALVRTLLLCVAMCLKTDVATDRKQQSFIAGGRTK